jgi:hypothetical protein
MEKSRANLRSIKPSDLGQCCHEHKEEFMLWWRGPPVILNVLWLSSNLFSFNPDAMAGAAFPGRPRITRNVD